VNTKHVCDEGQEDSFLLERATEISTEIVNIKIQLHYFLSGIKL